MSQEKKENNKCSWCGGDLSSMNHTHLSRKTFSPIVEEKEGWEIEFDKNFEPHEHWQGDEWVTDKVKRFIKHTLAEEREKIVKEIEKIEPAPKLDEYLDKVKYGNKDDMYDYGVKITRKMCINIIKNNK